MRQTAQCLARPVLLDGWGLRAMLPFRGRDGRRLPTVGNRGPDGLGLVAPCAGLGGRLCGDRGGEIDAEGIGVSLGATWRNDVGTYGDGRVSLLRYRADLGSSAHGRLKERARATARTLRVEVGRRLALGETVHLTPRAWLARTDVSLDGFRDAVGSRVSPEKAGRSDAGIEIVAGRDLVWDAGERILTLRGELGVERTLGDAETGVEVSGEQSRSGAIAPFTLPELAKP